MSEEKKKRLNVAIDADLHRRLKSYAALNDRTMSDAVVELITNELSQKENKKQENIIEETE